MIDVLTDPFDRVCKSREDEYINSKKALIEDNDDDGDISSDDGYYGLSPPPPYTKEDLIEYEDFDEKDKGREEDQRRSHISTSSCPSPVEANPTIEYSDVGEEIVATVSQFLKSLTLTTTTTRPTEDQRRLYYCIFSKIIFILYDPVSYTHLTLPTKA